MANEKRLIDANELLRIYKKWIPQLALPEDEGDKRGVETCIAVLEDQPTVDAVEVVNGQWIESGDRYICSVCTERSLLHFGGIGHCLSNYCPNCGAKMDGERIDNG